MKSFWTTLASKRADSLAVIRVMLAELGRLNRFAIASAPYARRHEQARVVIRELEQRYDGPHRCC